MIREYERGEHPAGFTGIRVVVTVNGEQRQEYFTFYDELGNRKSNLQIEEMREQAKELELEWKKEAQKHKELSFLDKDKSDLAIAPNLRLYVKATRKNGKLYIKPAFISQATKNSKTINSVKTFGSHKSARQAFEEILEDYMIIHKLTEEQKEKLRITAGEMIHKKHQWLDRVKNVKGMNKVTLKKIQDEFDIGYTLWKL